MTAWADFQRNERPWPLRPLLVRAKLSKEQLRNRKGFGGGAVNQAAIEGLTDHQADEWATRLGFHPSQVWGAAWDQAGLGPLDQLHIERASWRHAWLWRHGLLDSQRRPVADRREQAA
ncbi:MAG TPA: hypothetical protein VGW74_06945 [Propionibacteriaceae bacterium]|nr:hypothetical protein [Propionibacteriaceae bacterium]